MLCLNAHVDLAEGQPSGARFPASNAAKFVDTHFSRDRRLRIVHPQTRRSLPGNVRIVATPMRRDFDIQGGFTWLVS